MTEQPNSVTPKFKEATGRAALRGLRGLEQTAIMLETWAPEIFPGENEQGQKHFGRIMMECSATAIRDAWRGAIVEVVDFPDDPANLIEQRGRLRQALFDIAGLLQKALIAAEPNNTNFILISEARNVARDALKSPNLVEANPEPPTTLPQVCPSCNQPYKDGETCKAGRGGCPMGGDL